MCHLHLDFSSTSPLVIIKVTVLIKQIADYPKALTKIFSPHLHNMSRAISNVLWKHTWNLKVMFIAVVTAGRGASQNLHTASK